MNLIYCLVFNFCIESLCSLVLKRVLISEKVRCTLSALKIWIHSCKWINCKLTFQFNFSRGTETISWILHFVLSHRLSLLLCLKLNYRIFFGVFFVCFMLFFFGHIVMTKVVCVQGCIFSSLRERIFFLIFTSV